MLRRQIHAEANAAWEADGGVYRSGKAQGS